jgi:hypothetical protein
MNPTTLPPSNPEVDNISQEIVRENPKDRLSKAIDEYVNPIFFEHDGATSNWEYVKDRRDGPFDVATN